MSIRKREWETAGGTKSAFVVDFKDNEGKRRRRHFTKRKDAVAWWEGQQGAVAVKEGAYVSDRDSITVREAGELWLRRCASHHDGSPPLERSTLDQYAAHLRWHINPFIGGEKLTKLTVAKVKWFETKLAEEGRSAAMVKKVVVSLGSLIENAKDHGLVGRNPVRERPKRTRGKRHRRKPEVGRDIPTKVELKAIIDAATGRCRPLVVTAIFTGLRASELRGLTWDAVDFKAKVIRVRQRADRYGQFGPPKSEASQRDVPMGPMVVNTLREWKLACPPGDLVFPNRDGGLVDLSSLRTRALGPLQKAAGLTDDPLRPKYGLHALRHAAASLWIELGVEPKKIQTWMGHSTITLTFDTYGHLFPSSKSDAKVMAQAEKSVFG